MKVILNETKLLNELKDNPKYTGKCYGRLNYPDYFFPMEFLFVKEFNDDKHGEMIEVSNPRYTSNLMFIKDDSILVGE